jgi:acetyltransferase-like isoleucine patch superfamily enzyme
MSWDDLVQRARRGEGPLRGARRLWRGLLRFYIPWPRPLSAFFYAVRGLRQRFFPLLLKAIYREPVLRYRCARVGTRLHLEGEIPLIIGNGRIEIGNDVVIGRRNTWVVGLKGSVGAELIVEDGVSINYATLISVMKRVHIGAHTLIASNVQIYDNGSHPLDPERRLRNEAITLDESSPVTIGKNVWIASGAIILSGVDIGDHSVVAAGAVVTKSVPPRVVVAGNPARVVRELGSGDTAPDLP